jgi:hypothetical protein
MLSRKTAAMPTMLAMAIVSAVMIPTGPAHGAVTSLNGTWQCEEALAPNMEIPPSSWEHTIPVPGLSDMAQPALGTFDYLFCQTTFAINGMLPDVVILKIHKGYWGKKVWVNGNLAGEDRKSVV